MQLVLLVAVADNGVIGQSGGIPWRLKSDLAHFRAASMGKPVVMGRKTYASIGKPLAGRTNIVVTRDRTLTIPGVLVTTGVAQALAAARGDALRRSASEIVIIGGADIYEQTFALAGRLEVTHVHARPDGDTYFPDIDPAVWQEVSRAAGPVEPGQPAFTFARYERRAKRGVAMPAAAMGTP
jgi:dihydrofolate reductase